MVRQQINIKLPPELIEALREKASTEEVTLTELIQGYCEQGLGLPPSNHQTVDTALLYERIVAQVDNRIASQLDMRIPDLEEPLLTQLEERIAFIVDARIASQVALLEQRMATQLGEQIREGFSMACEVGKELGRELEKSKQQSPISVESAIGEEISAPATPANELVEEEATVSPGRTPKRKTPAEVKAIIETKMAPGEQLKTKDLAALIGVTPAGIRHRRDAKILHGWGVQLVKGETEWFERLTQS